MLKFRYHTVLPLVLAVSLFTLMKVQGPAKISPFSQASEQSRAPIDQDVPVDSEDQGDTNSVDNESDEDAMIFEKFFLIQPMHILKQTATRPLHFFIEHFLEITTPPPRV